MPTISAPRRALRRRALKAVRTRRLNAMLNGKLSEAQFVALPKRIQRILLALDVLNWIRNGTVAVCTGSYVSISTWPTRAKRRQQANSEAGQKCLLGRQRGGNPACTVCAKGAMFMAHVMRADEATVDACLTEHIGDGERLVDRFEVFDVQQYSLIECAFERTAFYAYEAFSDDAEEAVNFGRQYSSDADCLAAIMINMVENKGAFVPIRSISLERVNTVLENRQWGRDLIPV